MVMVVFGRIVEQCSDPHLLNDDCGHKGFH